jgi:hypothetical protein
MVGTEIGKQSRCVGEDFAETLFVEEQPFVSEGCPPGV